MRFDRDAKRRTHDCSLGSNGTQNDNGMRTHSNVAAIGEHTTSPPKPKPIHFCVPVLFWSGPNVHG
jgi:hypothetical protein